MSLSQFLSSSCGVQHAPTLRETSGAMSDEQVQMVVHQEGEDEAEVDAQHSGNKPDKPGGEKIFEKYVKRSLQDKWMEPEVRVSTVFEELMEKGGPFKVELKNKEMAEVRKAVKEKVLKGGVGIEDPFAEAVKSKKGIKYEIHRLIKRQNSMVNTFNALAIMMKDIDRIGDEDLSEEEMWRRYESLKKVWKVAAIEHSKSMYDLGEDLKKLQFRAMGIQPPEEKPEYTIVTESDKEKVKQKLEERRLDASEKIAASAVIGRGNFRGRGFYSMQSNAPSYSDRGYGRGRGRGWSRGSAESGSRGRGRGSRN